MVQNSNGKTDERKLCAAGKAAADPQAVQRDGSAAAAPFVRFCSVFCSGVRLASAPEREARG